MSRGIGDFHDGDQVVTISEDPGPCALCGDIGLHRTCEVCHLRVCEKHYERASCCRREATLRALGAVSPRSEQP